MGPEGLYSHRHHIDVSLICQWRVSLGVGLTAVDSIRRDGLLHDVERSLEQFYDGAINLKYHDNEVNMDMRRCSVITL